MAQIGRPGSERFLLVSMAPLALLLVHLVTGSLAQSHLWAGTWSVAIGCNSTCVGCCPSLGSYVYIQDQSSGLSVNVVFTTLSGSTCSGVVGVVCTNLAHAPDGELFNWALDAAHCNGYSVGSYAAGGANIGVYSYTDPSFVQSAIVIGGTDFTCGWFIKYEAPLPTKSPTPAPPVPTPAPPVPTPAPPVPTPAPPVPTPAPPVPTPAPPVPTPAPPVPTPAPPVPTPAPPVPTPAPPVPTPAPPVPIPSPPVPTPAPPVPTPAPPVPTPAPPIQTAAPLSQIIPAPTSPAATAQSPLVMPSPNSPPVAETSPTFPVAVIVGTVVPASAVCVLAAGLAVFIFLKRRRNTSPAAPSHGADAETGGGGSGLFVSGVDVQPVFAFENLYTLAQLKKATHNFSEACVVGRGSFGTVYRAVLPNRAMVAVKQLEKRPGRQSIEDRSWRAEVEALGKLRHRNLVPLLGVCTEGDQKLLVFEFYSQGSLARRLHQPREGEPPLTWTHRFIIIRNICRGLIYLHNDVCPPVLHRDIKAANVLLTDALEARIADFGLAHLVQDVGENTSTMIKGTVPYMAPEYLHGGAKYLSFKCDVYSFGILLLEIVSGCQVVRQQSTGLVDRFSDVAQEFMAAGKEMELVDPKLGSEYDPQEARACLHVAMTCIQRDPSARPTMEQVGQQLVMASKPFSIGSEVDKEFKAGSLAALNGSLDSSLGPSGQVYGLGGGVQPSTAMMPSRFVTPR